MDGYRGVMSIIPIKGVTEPVVRILIESRSAGGIKSRYISRIGRQIGIAIMQFRSLAILQRYLRATCCRASHSDPHRLRNARGIVLDGRR